MNIATTEQAKKAANKHLTIAKLLNNGWRKTGFYEYQDESGNPIYWRIRLDPPSNSTENKWIRPFAYINSHWLLKEPDFNGKKLIYRLPDIIQNAHETVYVVEGEPCAEALKKLGLIATTSGSVSSVADADWDYLKNHKVIIWQDSDDAGLQYAQEVTKQLLAIDCSVLWIDVELLNLPPKGDCVDWLKLNSNATKEDIENLPLIDPILEQNKPEEIKPLQRQIADPTPFPIDALGKILGDAAKIMSKIIQAPLAICGQSVLAGGALATQGFANFCIDGRVKPLSCFFLTIGKTGERKSAIDAAALKPHYARQIELYKQYKSDFKAWKKEIAAYESIKKQILNSTIKKDFADKSLELTNLGDPPIKPIEPLIIAEEPTYEGLIKMLENGQPVVGLFSDEGARFIGGYGMNNDNMLKTAAGLCGLWDGKPINRVRAADGNILLLGKRVSFHLMAQPNIAQILLSNNTLLEQGLLSRCLTTWPPTTIGKRPYNEDNLYNHPDFLRYEEILTHILHTTLPLTENTLNELEPRQLYINKDAKKLWISFHDKNEEAMQDGGLLASIQGLANKAPEHVLRIAGILALIDDINAASISLNDIVSAIKLVTHYLNEALRLFNSGINDPELNLATELLNWLCEKGKTTISLVEIYQYSLSSIRNAATAKKIMNILVEHGYAEPIADGVKFEGIHRKEAWNIKI